MRFPFIGRWIVFLFVRHVRRIFLPIAGEYNSACFAGGTLFP